jgi:hypothetical protein
MSLNAIKKLFLVAALYDIILGIVFAVLFKPVYAAFGAALPNNDGYIQLLALLIFTFGVGFYLIYRNPVQNRQFTILAIMMKLSFGVVVFGHLVFDAIPIPQIYIPLATIDLLFVPFFAVSYSSLKKLAVSETKRP